MTDRALDILAFAAHPDDAEISCGGTLAIMADRGYRTGILDLTRGELGSQGSVEKRQEEAGVASTALGLALRLNLGLPDGMLSAAGTTAAGTMQLHLVVHALRSLRPTVVLAPYWVDRHPDHVAASELVSRATFFSGLKKFTPAVRPEELPPELARDSAPAPFLPAQLLYYQFRSAFHPSFVVDISSAMGKKAAAIQAFHSQIVREAANPGGPSTLISSPLTVPSLAARDALYGAMIGTSAGEPFYSRSAIPIADPVAFFRSNPGTEALFYPEHT